MTLGSDLTAEPEVFTNCSHVGSTRGCLAVQATLPGRELVAPFDGVVVRWTVRVGLGTAGQTVRARVVQPVGEEEFRVIRSSSPEYVSFLPGTYSFPAALPIAAGDRVALEAEGGKDIVAESEVTGPSSWLFDPESEDDGVLTGPPVFPETEDQELLMNAEVEPDCDGDGRGDETQDSDTASCNPPPHPPPPTGLPQGSKKTCVVPNLKGKKLKAAGKRARKANCRIGPVKLRKGATRKTGKVVRQKPKAGKVKAAGSKIAVTLG